MTDRYSDYEELRPLGEATQIPDGELAGDSSSESGRHRTGETLVGYPDDSAPTASECASCGASIPASQTKCRFCLTNHLSESTDKQRPSGTEWTLLHVVHLLVEASTAYSAIAKGAAAATLLSKPDRDSAVDDCQLIYYFDEAPAGQLTDHWPSLPEAVRATSDCGEQLLSAARERTTWTETTQAPSVEAHTPYLYDEGGNSLCDVNRLTDRLESAAEDIWVVPAIALERSVDDEQCGARKSSTPTGKRLECRRCDRPTKHRYQECESHPNESRTGQPIWKCHVCRTPRYGPNPK